MKKPDHYQEIYVKKSQIEREVKDFKRLCTVAQDPKLRESERTYYQNGNRNLDYQIYAYTLDLNGVEKFSKVSPIAYLASIGCHQAVEFLIECGCDSDYALQGYGVGGYLSNEESILKVLQSISNVDIKIILAEKILTVNSFDNESLFSDDFKSNVISSVRNTFK